MRNQCPNIHQLMDIYRVPGVSIALIEEGSLSFIEGYGVLEKGSDRKVDTHSIFNACSISKFTTAILTLKMVDDGLLNLDEDVNERLISWKVPENNLTEDKKVTLRSLLSHQSGFIDPTGSFEEKNLQSGIPNSVELLEGKTAYCPKPIEVEYEPGSDFQYSDAGYCLIRQLIEDVSGKPFEQMMVELIWKPLKITNSTYELQQTENTDHHFSCGHDSGGKLIENKYSHYPYPSSSGLWSTPTDISRLVVEVMDGLKGRGKLDISKKMLEEMISPQGCSQWVGLGVFLDKSPKDREILSLGWGVGYQSMLLANPISGKGIVVMTNADLGVHQNKGIIGEIINSFTLNNLS